MSLNEDAMTPESSTGTENPDVAVETAAAESSPATDETDVSSLSVIRDVVEKGKEGDDQAASSAAGEEGEKPADADSQEEQDEYKDVPFHQHPRFREVTRELRQAKKELRQINEQIQELGGFDAVKRDAIGHRQVREFMSANGLSDEEVAEGLIAMAQAKVDPAAAWQQIRPWVEKLVAAAGEVLPEDLAQRVQAGELPRDVAYEMSRLRAQQQSAQVRQSFEQQRRAEQQRAEMAASLQNAAAQWERDRQLKDPNFAKKLPIVRAKIAEFQLLKPAATPDEVRQYLEDAYKFANEHVASGAAGEQRKAAKTPITGGTVAGTTQPAPQSTVDIIRNVVAKHAG